MALKVTNIILQKAYKRFKEMGSSIKSLASNRATLLTDNITENNLRNILDNFIEQRSRLVEVATTPGLSAYAQEQENDPTYDVVAEYNTMKAALDAVIATLTADLPAERVFTPAQTATLKTQLEALDASMS